MQKSIDAIVAFKDVVIKDHVEGGIDNCTARRGKMKKISAHEACRQIVMLLGSPLWEEYFRDEVILILRKAGYLEEPSNVPD